MRTAAFVLLWLVFIHPSGAAQQIRSVPAETSAIKSRASYLRYDDYRVARVGYHLGFMGAHRCQSPYPLTGLSLHHLAEYARPDHARAIARFHLDRGPGVLTVVENSPAARAGLRAGDVILAINGKPLPSGPATSTSNPKTTRVLLEQTERLLESDFRNGPAELAVLRDGLETNVALRPISGCAARVRLARSTQFNAFANRGYAVVTTNLLRFLKSDDELAVILGHEMAHVILGHAEVLEAQGVPGGLLRGLGKNARRIRATEEEADRLGLQLTMDAGYDARVALAFWRRYSARVGPRLFATHPSLKVREKTISDTIASFQSKHSSSMQNSETH